MSAFQWLSIIRSSLSDFSKVRTARRRRRTQQTETLESRVLLSAADTTATMRTDYYGVTPNYWQFQLSETSDVLKFADRYFGLNVHKTAVSGDWDGNGATDVGVVFADGGSLRWLLDTDDDPDPEFNFTFGFAADRPVTGDWNGDGITNVGVVRPDAGLNLWLFDTNFTPDVNLPFLRFGFSTDIPVAGDWDGDGVTEAGAVRKEGDLLRWYVDYDFNSTANASFIFGLSTATIQDTPLAGDWNGDRKTDAGVVRNESDQYTYLYRDVTRDNSGTPDLPKLKVSLSYGGGMQVVSGHWSRPNLEGFYSGKTVPTTGILLSHGGDGSPDVSWQYPFVNSGNAPLLFTDLSVPPGFVVSDFPTTLAPGAQVNVKIALDPGVSGFQRGMMSFRTNEGNQVYNLVLQEQVPAAPDASKTVIISHNQNGGPPLEELDGFGSGLAAIGDLDGDGIEDLATSTPGPWAAHDGAGEVYILFMTANATVREYAKIGNGIGGGPVMTTRNRFGWNMDSIGDFDHDGIPDLAVGAPSENGKGAVYLLLMNRNGTVRAHQKISSEAGGGPVVPLASEFGAGVESIGDFDGDGVTDLAIGATYEGTGAVYITLLRTDGSVKSFKRITSGVNGGPPVKPSTHGLPFAPQFGSSIALLGDVDGNGVNDLAVGARREETADWRVAGEGAIYVLRMNSDGSVMSYNKISSETGGGPLELSGGHQLGGAIDAPGDLNGDGIGDLVAYSNMGLHLLYLDPLGRVAASGLYRSFRGIPWLASKGDVVAIGDRDGNGTIDFAVGSSAPADTDSYSLFRGQLRIIYSKPIDSTPPQLQSIRRNSPVDLMTNADLLSFRVAFSESVTEISAADFAVVGGNQAGVSAVTAVTGTDNREFDVVVSGGGLPDFNGPVGLNLATNAVIIDMSGNLLPRVEPPEDQVYELDNTVPVLTGIRRHNPQSEKTSSDTLIFRLTFSEPVTDIGGEWYSIIGPASATAGSVSSVAGSNDTQYDIVVSGGDLPDFNGIVGLQPVINSNILDRAGNRVSNREPSVSEVYIVENLPPQGPSLVVTTTADSGLGSLRDVILLANTIAVDAIITFDIPENDPGFFDVDTAMSGGDADPDVFRIRPLSALPILNNVNGKKITLDAATQRDRTGDSNPHGPEVEIDGSLAGTDVTGLIVDSEGAIIQSLIVNQFDGFGLQILADDVTVRGVYVGLDATGRVASPNRGAAGVDINGAKNLTFGGLLPADRNVVSGNTAMGIRAHNNSNDLKVLGSFIGTDATGQSSVGNGSHGIEVSGSNRVRIGDTLEGAGNLISGNGRDGIAAFSLNQLSIFGNRVGTTVDGTSPLPNQEDGLDLFSMSDLRVGEYSAFGGNLVSANLRHGVNLFDVNAATVAGNRIGTDITGSSALANGSNGLNVFQGRTVDLFDNVVSGNSGFGVSVSGNNSHTLRMDRNIIGTDVGGSTSVANMSGGVVLRSGVTNVTIGGNTDGAGNLISGNAAEGVWVNGASGVLIIGNRIGTDLNGATAVGNQSNGVRVDSGSTSVTIGGSGSGEGNLISGNLANGLGAFDSTQLTVSGNRIGTDAAGSAAVPNHRAGIFLGSGSQFLIGGPLSGDRNLLSGNLYQGLHADNVMNLTITSNYVGVNADGTAALANGSDGNDSHGIRVEHSSEIIIGRPGQGNLISGNRFRGIGDYGNSNLTVQSNFIGTDKNGTVAIPNRGDGIGFFDSNHLRIGGANPGEGNLISGNQGHGIVVSGEHLVIQGNTVGTDVSGTYAIGNRDNGIEVEGSREALIGGDSPAAGNLVSGNNSAGVSVRAAFDVTVRNNTAGTNRAGTAAVGNHGPGIVAAHGSTQITVEQNLTSGNLGHGIFSWGGFRHTIRDNSSGTNRAGDQAIPNAEDGLKVQESTQVVASGNLIAGNSGNGLTVSMVSPDHRLVVWSVTAGGNGHTYLLSPELSWQDARALAAQLGGQLADILSADENAFLGTEFSGHEPWIGLSDADQEGQFVWSTGATLDPLEFSGFVAPEPNGGTSENYVQLTATATWNDLPGSRTPRAIIEFSSPPDPVTLQNVLAGVRVSENRIGLTADGSSPLGNDLNGVLVQGPSHLVTIEKNVVGHNSLDGIFVESESTQINIRENAVRQNGRNGVTVLPEATGVTIQENSIYGNEELGIDLDGNGRTFNDGSDADTGANGLQNFPDLSVIVSSGTSRFVSGSLQSTPNGTFVLEFFSDSVTDSNAAEGRLFLGRHSVTTDSSGHADFTFSLPAQFDLSHSLTATATDAAGSTSEFSGVLYYDRPETLAFRRQDPFSEITDADELTFRVFFSTAVTNISAEDFAVDGATTAIIGAVTPVASSGGSEFDVIVRGGNLAWFYGVVGLNFSSTAEITDLLGHPLTLSEPVVDETYTILNVDYGDAPDSTPGTGVRDYQTLAVNNGPRHVVIPQLYLGSRIDGEDGTGQNQPATADDAVPNGLDDEDGVLSAGELSFPIGTSPFLNVVVTNLTSQPAMVYAWLDLNRDGKFDTSERVSATVPASIQQQTVTLRLPTISSTLVPLSVKSYLRVRLSSDALAQNPTGPAFDGEVEDYEVTFELCVPTLSGPGPLTEQRQPEISWSALEGYSSYEVWVSNKSTGQNPIIRKTVSETRFVPDTSLGIGNYSVWIRGSGAICWSSPLSFQVNTRTEMNAVEASQTTYRPTVTWKPQPGAVRYELWADYTSGGVSQVVRTEQIVSSSWTPSSDLPLGNYSFWVRGIAADGAAAKWANAAKFSVAPPTEIDTTRTSTFLRAPEIRWKAQPGALQYQVYIRQQSTGKVLVNQSVTGTRFVPSTELTVGTYRIWVRGISSGSVASEWSRPWDLTVGGKPTGVTPTGTLSSSPATIAWQAVEGASSYEVWVNQVGGTPRIIHVPNHFGTRWDLRSPLPKATYRVWIRAYSSGNEVSVWSDPVEFRIV